jgi:hypothetical protein
VCCLFFFCGVAQTLGGNAAYAFLKLPATPLLTASGGVNVSYTAGEIGLTANNPALLQTTVNKQLNTSFNTFFAGAKAYSLTSALRAEKLKATFGGHLHYIDYGMLPMTDASGNVMGEFRPVDFVVQVSAARKYLEKWAYGLTLKFIRSSYGQFRSSAVAADVGVLYHDTSRLFSASVVVKNMGTQLTTYQGQAEELPFDLQAGFTKRLSKAPFGFSATAQHLQNVDILYSDTTFNRDNNFLSPTSTITKLITHLVLAAHIYAGKNLEATIGYNFLQRRELSIGTEGNGLTGFSAGLRARFSKLQVYYARSAYQRGVAANQIGITAHLDKLFGLGL